MPNHVLYEQDRSGEFVLLCWVDSLARVIGASRNNPRTFCLDGVTFVRNGEVKDELPASWRNR